MALILHIETATQVCSVALSQSGRLIGLRESIEKNAHSSLITVFIDDLMKSAGLAFSDLEAVAVSKGPGSYTGLRIGVSTAKGMCYALEKPLIAIGTLESMAAGMINEMTSHSNSRWSKVIANAPEEMTSQSYLLCPMIDARRMEVYSAVYDKHLQPVREIKAEIITEDSFSEHFKENIIYFAGDASEKCQTVLGHNGNARFLESFSPSAKHMIHLADAKYERSEFENVAYFEPFYLKDFIPGIPRVKGLRF
jgi:tRNA threonylcarbamoyladenosine biosynthesis protein TsaB